MSYLGASGCLSHTAAVPPGWQKRRMAGGVEFRQRMVGYRVGHSEWFNAGGHWPEVTDLLPSELVALVGDNSQKAIPAIAKRPDVLAALRSAARQVPAHHELWLGDGRDLSCLSDNSVQLVLTSPPYWTLKRYEDHSAQLGHVEDYDQFLCELDAVWSEAYRVLEPGGRMVVVVGDVCLARRQHGRHVVVPLHASIQEHCRCLGFDNLAPIIWHKIANISLESENGSRFLGKPYEPNAVVKNDIEYILFQRKPGGYRCPTILSRILSVIPESEHRQWFNQIWTIPGASTQDHPAPFPLALAERLIRMFSFVGDTVIDPFAGTGTTLVAASHWGRSSVGFEIEPRYFTIARERMDREMSQTQMTLPDSW